MERPKLTWSASSASLSLVRFDIFLLPKTTDLSFCAKNPGRSSFVVSPISLLQTRAMSPSSISAAGQHLTLFISLLGQSNR
jgi:hypothetical protein